MGASHDKPMVIDANNQQKQQQGEQNYEQYIKKAFLSASSNGRLYKDKFNEALSILENLNIKRIRDTPLSDRLFTLLDTVGEWVAEAVGPVGVHQRAGVHEGPDAADQRQGSPSLV